MNQTLAFESIDNELVGDIENEMTSGHGEQLKVDRNSMTSCACSCVCSERVDGVQLAAESQRVRPLQRSQDSNLWTCHVSRKSCIVHMGILLDVHVDTEDFR